MAVVKATIALADTLVHSFNPDNTATIVNSLQDVKIDVELPTVQPEFRAIILALVYAIPSIEVFPVQAMSLLTRSTGLPKDLAVGNPVLAHAILIAVYGLSIVRLSTHNHKNTCAVMTNSITAAYKVDIHAPCPAIKYFFYHPSMCERPLVRLVPLAKPCSPSAVSSNNEIFQTIVEALDDIRIPQGLKPITVPLSMGQQILEAYSKDRNLKIVKLTVINNKPQKSNHSNSEESKRKNSRRSDNRRGRSSNGTNSVSSFSDRRSQAYAPREAVSSQPQSDYRRGPPQVPQSSQGSAAQAAPRRHQEVKVNQEPEVAVAAIVAPEASAALRYKNWTTKVAYKIPSYKAPDLTICCGRKANHETDQFARSFGYEIKDSLQSLNDHGTLSSIRALLTNAMCKSMSRTESILFFFDSPPDAIYSTFCKGLTGIFRYPGFLEDTIVLSNYSTHAGQIMFTCKNE